MFIKRQIKNPTYFFPDDSGQRQLTQKLALEVKKRKNVWEPLILLCIGTDKITGDCLGPLAGSKLKERGFPHPVYGTLEHPVHALNLSRTISMLHKTYAHPFLLTVDAAVGPADRIGCVSLSPLPVLPGQGINRPLPPVGDLSLTGIVAEASGHCSENLPYTRLFMVDQLAELICGAVMQGVR